MTVLTPSLVQIELGSSEVNGLCLEFNAHNFVLTVALLAKWT